MQSAHHELSRQQDMGFHKEMPTPATAAPEFGWNVPQQASEHCYQLR